jgi:hypothetical protein
MLMPDTEKAPMAKLAALQDRINEQHQAMTPEQRAKEAKAALSYMPGQAYLLRSDEARGQ